MQSLFSTSRLGTLLGLVCALGCTAEAGSEDEMARTSGTTSLELIASHEFGENSTFEVRSNGDIHMVGVKGPLADQVAANDKYRDVAELGLLGAFEHWQGPEVLGNEARESLLGINERARVKAREIVAPQWVDKVAQNQIDWFVDNHCQDSAFEYVDNCEWGTSTLWRYLMGDDHVKAVNFEGPSANYQIYNCQSGQCISFHNENIPELTYRGYYLLLNTIGDNAAMHQFQTSNGALANLHQIYY